MIIAGLQPSKNFYVIIVIILSYMTLHNNEVVLGKGQIVR